MSWASVVLALGSTALGAAAALGASWVMSLRFSAVKDTASAAPRLQAIR